MIKKKLYEITVKGAKTFYVEAESQSAALEHQVVFMEMESFGDIEWEVSGADAVECDEVAEDDARKHHEKRIFD